MDKVIKITKELNNLEKKYLINKLIVLVKNLENSNISYIDKLFFNSFNLLNELNDDLIYNTVDNNLFELENLIEELELNINISVDIYVYLNSKTNSYLRKLVRSIENIIEEEGNVLNGIKTIKQYQVNIISKYLRSLYSYLLDNHSEHLLNIESLQEVINDQMSSNDWKHIYKLTNTIHKTLNISDELIKDKYMFEVAYFLINMEG